MQLVVRSNQYFSYSFFVFSDGEKAPCAERRRVPFLLCPENDSLDLPFCGRQNYLRDDLVPEVAAGLWLQLPVCMSEVTADGFLNFCKVDYFVIGAGVVLCLLDGLFDGGRLDSVIFVRNVAGQINIV